LVLVRKSNDLGVISGGYNYVSKIFRIVIILGLLLALTGPFAKVAYAADEPEVPKESTPQAETTPEDATLNAEVVPAEAELSPNADAETEGSEIETGLDTETDLSDTTDSVEISDVETETDTPVETQTTVEGDPIEGEGAIPEDSQEPSIDEVEITDTENPEAAFTETPSNESQLPPEDTNQKSSIVNPQSVVPDPYFFINGDKHSFLPEGGDCAGAANCQVSTTPIQDALEAVSGGLTPDDQTIYIEGGIYTEDVSINEMSDLTLLGAADNYPSTLAGSVSVSDSLNITLRNFIFGEVIQISDSSDVTIAGTEGDDQIDVDLNGTVENVSVEGGAGSDAITINQEAESSAVLISGGEGDDSLTVYSDEEDLEVDDDEVSSQDNSVAFSDSVESLQVEAPVANILVSKSVALSGVLGLSADNLTISGDLAANEIIIESGETTRVSGSLDAPGGRVHLLGDKVFLIEDAQIDVSAEKGGGTVLVGGDYQGKGFLPTASRTYVGPNAAIKADSLTNGDGGRVIVWADEVTLFYGEISAQGGPQGGDGGFVEVSGKKSLSYIGEVNTLAPAGQTGTLLLDPDSINVIASGAHDSLLDDNIINYTEGSGDSTISASKVLSSLASANTILQAQYDITISSAILKSSGGDATLRLEAYNSIRIDAAITSTSNKLNIILNADSDQDGTGHVNINANLISNGGDITIIGADVNFNSNVQTGGGDLTLTPSRDNTPAGFGTGAGGGFYVAQVEFAWLSLPNGTLTIGRSTSTNDMEIGTVSVTNYNMVIFGNDVIFKGELNSTNRSVQVNANGDIKDGNGATNDVKLDLAIAYLLIDAQGAFGTSADPIETILSNFASESDSGGVFLTNTGGLNIGSTGRLDGQTGQSGNLIDGIISHGGVTVIASSPLRVSRAIRENAGGDINLTAGNDSSNLGDDLTIEADVVVTGSTGRITGNAGDNINTDTSTNVCAPEGVNFNAGLDGNADNGGGVATISGALEAKNQAAPVNVNGPNGVNLTASSQIITNGGNATLNAANGLVARIGIINLNGGTLTVNEKPADPAAGGGTEGTTGTDSTADGATDSTTASATGVSGAATLLQTTNGTVLTVTSGQPVSLLTAAALGSTVNLQLPEGNGGTFITGIDATVTITASGEVQLPAELPDGFNMLDSLEIAVDTQLTDEQLGGILVCFGLPTDVNTPIDELIEELVILQYIEEEGWVEMPLEESLNGMIEALAETGGVFVLAQGSQSTAAPASAQPIPITGDDSAQAAAALSGNTNQPVILELSQGNTVTVSGGAGDAVTASTEGPENLPADLPTGSAFLNCLSVDVTQGGNQVSILPNGEGIEVSFDVPEGVSPEDVVILYWLDVLNGGQGGWQEFTPEITPDGRVTLHTFFDGAFVLANNSG